MGIRRMRRATVQFVALASLSGCGLLSTPTADPAPSTGSVPPSSTSPSGVATAAPTAATTAAGATPIAAPTVVTGSGDAIVPVTKPAGATTVIATITGNAAAQHFYVRYLDAAQNFLVDTTAPYSGSTLLDPGGGSSTELRVKAEGPWSITLSDPRSAAVFSDSYSGTGDDVLVYEPALSGFGGDVADISGTSLVVSMYSDGVAATLIRTTGPWSGVVRWPFDAGLVSVRATGPWSITVHRTT